MKHKWQITPRGHKTKYYTCERCNARVAATSRKEADVFFHRCKERE